MSKRDNEMFQCPACYKTALLPRSKRHWCDCNPKAPFPMESERMKAIVSDVMRSFRPVLKGKP